MTNHRWVEDPPAPRKPIYIQVDVSGLNLEWLRQYAKRSGTQKGSMGKAVHRLARAVAESDIQNA